MESHDVQSCPCPGVKCPAHGQCAVCIAKHKAAGNVPYCLREVVVQMVERTVQRRMEQAEQEI